MKGAIAVPWASIRRTPNSNITITMGKSQNFFRVFRNSHNSARKDMAYPLKLLGHTLGWRTGRMADDPIRVRIGRRFQAQRVGAAQARNSPGRRENKEEQNRGEDRIDDPTQ